MNQDKISGVYKIINIANNKYYLGSSKDIYKRFETHKKLLNANKHINNKLQNAWNKYGENNFIFTILDITNNYIDLENIYLSEIQDFSLIYNIGKNAFGGDNISNHPNLSEIKLKHSVNGKNRWNNMSIEEQDLYRKKYVGDKNPNYNNRWTKEQREHLSKVKKEYFKTNSHRIKGKTFEDFYGEEKAKKLKDNLSKKAKEKIGEKNPFYGKHHSEETKQKIRDKRKGKKINPKNIRKVKINNIEYRCVTDAAVELKVTPGTIIHRIKSKNPKYSNYFYLDFKCATTIEKY